MATLALAPPHSLSPPLQKPTGGAGSRKSRLEPLLCQEEICFKCSQEDHWKDEAPMYGKSPPRPYKREGHWQCDCPQSQRGLEALNLRVAKKTEDWQGSGPSLASKGHLDISLEDMAGRIVVFFLFNFLSYESIITFIGELENTEQSYI